MQIFLCNIKIHTTIYNHKNHILTNIHQQHNKLLGTLAMCTIKLGKM